jgi:hypothetical protein
MFASLHGRLLAAVALVAVSVGYGGAAYADQISNDLDSTVEATAEVMPLNVGSADGTTVLRVLPANNDGKNGCNLTGSTIATFSVTSSADSVATVSPGTVTFTSCEMTPTLTVTANAVGTATITLAQTANTTGGSFDVGPASFTVNVALPANTAPIVQVTGVGQASYELGVDTLPTPGCAASDAEDGPSAPEPTIVESLDGFDLGTVWVTCSYTDGGGLTVAASGSYTVVDTIDPVIALESQLPAANANGWNNGDVTVTWTCTDTGSGVVEESVQEVVGSEGADQSATGTCTDNAGNPSVDSVTGINVDRTAPEVSWTDPITDGSSYYFGAVPAAPTCSATDALSGLDGACAVGGYATTVGTHGLTAGATDLAGNVSQLSSSYTVMAWTLNGYYKPVDMGGVWNTVKNGSTVPLKFEAFMGSAEITDVPTLDAAFTVKGVTCPGAGAPTDDVELTTTGGTTFRYDASGGQFIQNWQTPKKAGACYEVITTTADDSRLSALFKLK